MSVYRLVRYECGDLVECYETPHKKSAKEFFLTSNGYTDCIDLYIDGDRIPFGRAAKALGIRAATDPYNRTKDLNAKKKARKIQ